MRLAERTIVLLGEAVEASPATSFLVALQPSQLFHSLRMISTSFNMFNLRHLKTPAISKVTVSCDVSLVTNLQLLENEHVKSVFNLWTWTIDDHRWPAWTSLWPNLGELRAVMALLTRGPTVSEPGNIGNAPGLQWITCRYMPLHASAILSSCGSIPCLFVTPALLWESLKPRCMAHISATAFHCFALWAAATGSNCKTVWRCLEVTLPDSMGI